MKKNGMVFLVSVLAVFLTISIVPNSIADDIKTFGGAVCFPNNGNDGKDLRHWYTGTYNASNRRITVNCPLLKDEWSGLSNGIGYATVNIQQGTNRFSQCILQSMTYNAGTVDSHTRNLVGSGSMAWSSIDTYNAGNLMLHCHLAPYARLIRIYWTENGDTQDQ